MNTINIKVQELQQQKEALNARIAKLEELEDSTTPVKNLLVSLLANYATEALEELPIIWEEILTIGQQHGLSVQPLAADELQQWEADRMELQNLRLEVGILRSQLPQVQQVQPDNELKVWRKGEIAPELENLYQEALIENTNADSLSVNTDKEYHAAVEEELALDDDEKDIPALTLWQPWATLIQEEVKRIETRSWGTNYRGPIAIYAAKQTVAVSDYPHLFELAPYGCEFPFGAVVAIANLVNCVEMTEKFIAQQSEAELKCSDWKPGRFAWILEIIRPVIPPIPATGIGGQKLWNWSGTSIAAELECLEKSKATLESEYEPEEASDTVKSVLKAKGFFQPNDLEDYDSNEKYETYRGWDIYYSLPNGGIVLIGLYDTVNNQPWDASTEYIQEIDSIFPESLAGFDEIVKWTRALIDQVENVKTPGQLSLEFFESTSEQEDKEEVTPEQTELQKLLAGNSDFTFEELGVSVEIQSVFTEKEIKSEDEDESDDPATEKVEEALITTCNAEGRHWEYYVNAQTFIYQYTNTIDSLEQAALGYAQHFLRDLEKEAKKNTQWNIENAQQSEPAKPDTETEFEMMELKVRVHPQLPMGVTFRFLNPDNTLAFSNSLISAEIGDRTWKVCASDLIQNFRDKEAARIDKEANPYKKPEDEFVEFVKISNAVGYLKRRDNDQLIAGYAAFSNKLPDGHRASTQAKSRAAKWAEWLKGTFELECDAPRIAKRIISDNSKQSFAYEVKIKGVSIGQLTKLAEEDFSLLPGEVEEQQQNTESETKASPTSPGEIERATEPRNDGLTDEQYSKAVEEELALDDDDSSELATPPVKFTGLTLTPGCGLNEDELELVEMAKAAILECDSEMVKSVNLVFKEVCEKNAANRVKVWNSLTEKEQQTYKLLLQMEFAKAPDFAKQTPEYVTYIDGKMVTNVWISLREVDSKLARIWRYKGQKDESGYATKEAAAIAAISQQAG